MKSKILSLCVIAMLAAAPSVSAQTVTLPSDSPQKPAPPPQVEQLNLPPVKDPLWMHLVLAGAFTGIASDIGTTEYALGKGTFHEGNPILRPFAVRGPIALSVAKSLIGVGEAELLLKVHKTHPLPALIGAIAIGTVSFWAAGHNQRLTGK